MDRVDFHGPPRLTPPRFVMRPWLVADAPLLQVALETSRSELQAWTPWVLAGAGDRETLEERLDGYRRDFFGGGDLLYALLDEDEEEVLGGAGLYRRVGPGGLEVGYWIRSDRAGRGYATDAAAELTRLGLSLPGVDRLEIHCRDDHGASIRIAEKLGYRHRETVPASDDGGPATLIWETRGAD